jgi:hypothetical protein
MTTDNPSLNNVETSQQDFFVDRRSATLKRNSPGLERRQFTDGHANLSPEAAELGNAIDQYKLHHRRRYISYEEMLTVIRSLGYRKDPH